MQPTRGGGRLVRLIALGVVGAALAATSSAKSVYLIKDLYDGSPIQAYGIRPAPECVTLQGQSAAVGYSAVGLAIDDASATLFVTVEYSGILSLVDARTLAVLGTASTPGATNLAGIAVDSANRRVFAVDRCTNCLFVYDWDAAARSLTIAEVVTLPGVGYACGLAFDETTGWLFVTDLLSPTVRYFQTSDWSLAGTFTVSQIPMGIAVDGRNGLVYTGNAYVYAGYPALLIQHDLRTGTEQSVNLRALTQDCSDCVVGIAVDPDSGLIYITTGNEVWGGTSKMMVFDQGLRPLYSTPGLGNPTGICVPTRNISYGNRRPKAEAGPNRATEQSDHAGASVTLDGSASSDDDDDPLTYKWRWAGGAADGVSPTVALPHGETAIGLVVNDGLEDSDPDTVTVTIEDTSAPELVAPADVTVEQSSCDGTLVDLGQALPVDACDAEPVVTNDAPEVFPLGETVVTWTATDAAGNVTTATQKVTVVDTTPPEIESVWADPAALWPANGRMVDVTVEAVVSDACDAEPAYRIVSVASNEPGGNFFFCCCGGGGGGGADWQITGDHTVKLRAERSSCRSRTYTITIEATDASGNRSRAATQVLVTNSPGGGKKDTTPPAFLLVWAWPPILWPPNHQMVSVTVYAVLRDSGDPSPTYRITKVTSSEPAGGCGSGNTSPDWQITGNHTVKLRAERSGNRTGRVYTLTLVATDASGNTSTDTVTVTVPHDQCKKPCKW